MQFLDDTYVHVTVDIGTTPKKKKNRLSAAASRIYFGGIFLKKINKNINTYNFHLTQHWEKLGKTATKTQQISQKYTFETSQQIEKFGLA